MKKIRYEFFRNISLNVDKIHNIVSKITNIKETLVTIRDKGARVRKLIKILWFLLPVSASHATHSNKKPENKRSLRKHLQEQKCQLRLLWEHYISLKKNGFKIENIHW